MGFCHGDLTLSNILFENDEVFFLDFLDSYIESWIIDLVKLKQDLFYFWSMERDGDPINFRASQVSLKIWNDIESSYFEKTKTDEFKILEALNFLRIYPYIKSDTDLLILDKIIKKLPIYEEFNNSDVRKIL